MEQGTREKMYPLRLTDQEREMIARRMEQAGIPTMSTYMRKMAIDGYILKLELPEIKEMISLLRHSSNNLNQIAKKANAMGTVFEEDLKEIKSMQDEIWDGMNQILKRLGQMQ
ncbi:MAG: MobC family plasmid mobilization relaxosome protein [Clostridia bacterium]|nr:MobC family plasmid mobilization relaxosome protein [Clostridia bacterium]